MRNVPVKERRHFVILAAIVSISPLWAGATTAQDDTVPTQVVSALYRPVEAEVLAEYHRDRANKKLQTWRQYWDWVQTFYNGNILSEGWTRFSQVTLGAVKSDSSRHAVVKNLNELGKLISREWAKDASVRKITTTDLRRWNDSIIAARRGDDGSGERILDTLKLVRENVEKLKGL
jgi:hypothetical protein